MALSVLPLHTQHLAQQHDLIQQIVVMDDQPLTMIDPDVTACVPVVPGVMGDAPADRVSAVRCMPLLHAGSQ